MNNLAEKRPTPNAERSISNDRTRAIESESGILLLLERWMLDVERWTFAFRNVVSLLTMLRNQNSSAVSDCIGVLTI